MKRITIIVLMSTLIGACADNNERNDSANSRISSGPGNGGALIIREGNELTFGQSKVKIYREQLDNVPALTMTMNFIKRLPLPATNRGQILRALKPVGSRQYYRVDEVDLGPEKRKELIERYRQALGDLLGPDTLKIVAVTVGTETFLLPGFFDLKDDFSRAAILFHEALWIMDPSLSYKLVLASEIHFENYLRENFAKTDMEFDSKFMQTMKLVTGDALLGIAAAANFEFSKSLPISYVMADSGLKRSFQKPVFKLNEIIGAVSTEAVQFSDHLNTNTLFSYLEDMIEANPKSVLWKELQIEALGLDLLRVGRWSGAGGVNDVIGWAAGIGEEEFDVRNTGSAYHYYVGISGTGGMIDKKIDEDGRFSRLIAIFLISKEMQARVPNAIIADKEKCETVELYWEKEKDKPVIYKRCYQQWIED